MNSQRTGKLLEVGPAMATAVVAVAAGVLVGVSEIGSPQPMLFALVAASGGILLLTLPTEYLFLGWLLGATLLQNSAGQSSIGSPLQWALYLAPVLVMAVRTVLEWDDRRGFALIDAFPAVFVLYATASLVATSTALQDDVLGASKSVFQALVIGVVAYYFLVFGPGSSIRTERILYTLLAAASLQGLLSIVDWSTGWNVWLDNELRGGGDITRAVSTLKNPAVLGTFLGLGVVLAVALLAWDHQRSAGTRRLAWLTLALATPGLLLTFTRGPIIATAVVASAVIFACPRTRVLGLGVGALAAFVILVAWPSITSSTVYEQRISQRENVEERVLLQEWSLELFADRPILGWGYGSFDRVKSEALASAELPLVGRLGVETTSHNTFLTALVELGLLGALLVYIPWLLISFRARRTMRRLPVHRWMYVGVLASLGVVVLSATTFDFRFFSFVPALPWILVGLMRRDDAGWGKLPSAS